MRRSVPGAMLVLCFAILTFTHSHFADIDFAPRAVLGISVIDVHPGLVDVVKLPSHRGAYVVRASNGPTFVRPGEDGLAGMEGIWPEDLIVSLNSQPITCVKDLSDRLARMEMEDGIWPPVMIEVLRAGKKITVDVRPKSAPPIIYLPADTCPTVTTGEMVGLEFMFQMLFGSPVSSVSPEQLAGVCPAPVAACAPLQLERQDERRTVIERNDFSHEIRGDWRAHTHLNVHSCLAEKRRLDALAASDAASHHNQRARSPATPGQ